MQEKGKKESLRINTTLYGELSKKAKELKQLGVARNSADLIRLAVSCLYKQSVEDRLKTLRLKALEKTEKNEYDS